MLNLGWPEVALIVLLALLVLGPKKIPELGAALGRTLKGFKSEVTQSTLDNADDRSES